MQEIKCPKCGAMFTVDESGYAAIVRQVHDAEFTKEIERREKELKAEKETAVTLAVTKTEAQKDREIAELRAKLDAFNSDKTAEIARINAANAAAIALKEQEIQRLSSRLELDKVSADTNIERAVQEKEKELLKLQNDLALEQSKRELQEKNLVEAHAAELRRKDEEIAYYKDFPMDL